MDFEPVELNNLYNLPGSRTNTKRLGRGIGSGKGKTSGRGVKGQKSRSGVAIKGFEGGQMPIIKRLPKRGFNPLNRFRYILINIDFINYLLESKMVKENDIIDKDFLLKINAISSLKHKVKILNGNSDLSSKLSFDLDAYSSSARLMIEKTGGTIK